MRAFDEDALYCDFREFYGIRGFGSLTVQEEAILAHGLPPQSRIMKAAADQTYDFGELLLAGILDQMRVQNWKSTEDAKHKRNFPKSILQELIRGKKEKEEAVMAFDSADDFESKRQTIIERG